ncbi:MAG: hypothetical protein IJM26_01715 [Lachnospiraceae bacterium]|nr:hypothetical protein [Lachnospiraceae bacterium]
MAHVTLNFESDYLNQNEQVEIILPDKERGIPGETFYASGKKYKVLWLLHGTYGDATDWQRKTRIELFASEKDMIVVMPSGLNSDFVSWPKFAMGYDFPNFFVKELMPLVQNWFPASDKREDNFIAGLSMGGQGATQLGFAYPEKFAAIGCFSYPLLNYRARANGDALDGKLPEMSTRFANQVANYGTLEDFLKSGYNTWDVYFDAKKRKNLPEIHFYIGEDDFFWEAHCEMKKEMKRRRIKNVPITEYPGLHHEWRVWDMAVEDFIRKVDPETVGAGMKN